MRILLVEDSWQIQEIIPFIKSEGYEVDLATDLVGLDYLVNDSPKLDAYQHIFLDLNLSKEGLPEEYWDEADFLMSGWVYLNNILLEQHPEALPKVILLSAFIPILKNRVPEQEWSRFNIIDKTLPNVKESVMKYIKGLR